MSAYFAALLTRAGDRWSGRNFDMESVDDLDGLVEVLRDATPDAGLGLFFLEEDDEYFAIVRVDADSTVDARIFISDGRAVGSFPLASLVMAEALPVGDDDDEEEEGARPEVEPIGDADVVADLGVPAETLLELSTEEGLLPADVITTICEKAGCADVLERVREE
ncbi:MAG: tRNA adenosine deaminase-associated protein [Mycobacteriales bacterium]|nr:tRNA adenosine deaminase-associated protein [Actinomycetota bacterium]